MASYVSDGENRLKPAIPTLDLFPSEARRLSVVAIAATTRYGGTDRAADAIGISSHKLAAARLPRNLRPMVDTVDALAAYAGLTRDQLLSGKPAPLTTTEPR